MSISITRSNPVSSGGGGGGGSGSAKVCGDPKATNYERFGTKDNSLCKYNIVTTTPTTTKPTKPTSSTSTTDPTTPRGSDSGTTGDPLVDSFVDCKPLISKIIKLGGQNDRLEVNRLISFLNRNRGEKLAYDGTYDADDAQAVIRFQEAYVGEILGPAQITKGTGIVAKYTMGKINVVYCRQQSGGACPFFTTYMRQGDTRPQAKALRKFLNVFMGTSLPLTQNYDAELKQAVINYQNTYWQMVLAPWDLKQGEGTGYYFKTTSTATNKVICQ